MSCALLVRALDRLTDACLALGDAGEAVKRADEAVELEPQREAGYQRLMRAHAAANNQAEALRAYERCRRLLVEELGAHPSAATQAIHLEILRGEGAGRESRLELPTASASRADARRPLPAAIALAPRWSYRRLLIAGGAVLLAAAVAATLVSVLTAGSPGLNERTRPNDVAQVTSYATDRERAGRGRVRVMLRRSFWSRVGRRPRIGLLAGRAAIAMAATAVAPVAFAATSHAFTASYTGHGSGEVSGTRASGSARLTGRGSIIGPGTLTGSASGVFISRTCVVFSGTAVLKGRPGSIELATRRAQACAVSTDGNEISFSGGAQITGGKATFAGARGTLSFTGTYLRQSGAVTISFRGRISF